MKPRLSSVQEVEQELKIRAGGGSAKASDSAAWEFRGLRGHAQWARRALRGNPIWRGSKGSASRTTDPRQQRVIVKASYTAHHADKVAAVLCAHVKYLGRDAASLDGLQGRFYDAATEQVDARQKVQEWQNDARHFRFIVSPEQSHEINQKEGGLTGYTRELMQRMERDLSSAGSLQRGTHLQWVAINHYNTDDLHTHLLVRGQREDGKELRIDRQYIQQGMAQAAREIATAWVGERTEQQMKRAADKELTADRYTALDALLERHLNAERRLQLKTAATPQAREQRRRVAARLQYLETMGLTTRDRHGRWTVDAELKPKLQHLARRNDILKSLYASLGPRSAYVASYRGDKELIGIVAGTGTHDELTGRRYLLVRDASQQLHYVRVANGEALAALEDGAIIRVSGADPQRLRTDNRIAEVARSNDGIYSTRAHRSQLPNTFDTRDVEAFLQSHERRLVTLEKAGAARRVNEGWRIADPAALAAGLHARVSGGLGVVQIVSARSIESQISARAWTWLDRQMLRQSQGKPASVVFDEPLQKAAAQRREWMIKHGHARAQGERYMLLPGSAKTLRGQEWESFQQTYRKRFGKPVRVLLPGADARGEYRGTVSLHEGVYVVVTGTNEAVLAPVQRVPPLAYGAAVQARTSTRGVAVISRLYPRTPRQSRQQSSEAERE